jgi:peptidoglycan/LPS O-acetylase OafA/YrhL
MAQSTQVNPVGSWSRVDGIDLLRGLAIFFVLMNHVNMQLLFAHVPYTQGLPKQLVWSLVWNGQQGVQIFFAVSGFLITSTSLRRWKSLAQVSVADFYRLRFARIAPLLVGLLAIQPAAPGACAAFRCEAGDGRIGTRAGGGADLPRESARGKTGIPAG